MKKILPSDEMLRVDRATVDAGSLTSLSLMENAAVAVTSIIEDIFSGGVSGERMLILCGRGNNGGDGAAIARLLTEAGARVDALLIGRVDDTSGDARINFGKCHGLSACEDDEAVRSAFTAALAAGPSVVIDAMFGTGLRRPLSGMHLELAESLVALKRQESDRPLIISVDVPSGVDSDRSEPIGVSVIADMTVTFTAPKPACVLPPVSTACGELFVADIGSPPELIDSCMSQEYLAEESDAADWLQATSFTDDSYKNVRGHAVLVAGSEEYAGAAVLCANAAIRSGAGLVTLATPVTAAESIISRLEPEVIVRSVSCAADLVRAIAGADALGIGSGLGRLFSRSELLQIIETRKVPTVVDADGLNSIAPMESLSGRGIPLILTPHQGEFLRLTGLSREQFESDRIGALRAFSTRSHVCVVLKGQRNLVGLPDGRVIVVPTGNPGLGKAGNGDNLAGMITGFLAQGARFGVGAHETLIAAVYIAGLAGDIAEERWGARVLTASDVRDCLSEAFRSLEF